MSPAGRGETCGSRRSTSCTAGHRSTTAWTSTASSDAVKALDADVLALQEVDRNQARSANADLTAVAAEAMGATEHRFVAALAGTPGATWMAATGEEQPDAAAYGIALLSRLPVLSWQVVRLSSPPTRVPMWFQGSRLPELVRDEPRVAVAARIETPYGGELTVANAHLSFVGWWGRQQLRRTMRGLEGADPLVLLGDLNMSLERATAVTRAAQPRVSSRRSPRRRRASSSTTCWRAATWGGSRRSRWGGCRCPTTAR